jgi:hypothetical protein
MGELNYMTEKRRQTTEFIRRHPGWFVWMTVRRIVHMWTGYWSIPANGRFEAPFDPELPLDPTVIALFSTLTILAIAGLWRAFAQRAHIAWPYAIVMLCFPLVYYVTHSDLRYRHPIDPMLVVLATFACVKLLSPEREKSAIYGNSGVQNTLVRMQGGTAKSRAGYQDFLARWKDADPDIPVLIAAKSGYAKIK